jgi:hypothetical protein
MNIQNSVRDTIINLIIDKHFFINFNINLVYLKYIKILCSYIFNLCLYYNHFCNLQILKNLSNQKMHTLEGSKVAAVTPDFLSGWV